MMNREIKIFSLLIYKNYLLYYLINNDFKHSKLDYEI